MNKKSLAISVFSLFLTNIAMAQTVPLVSVTLPLEEGGIFAIAGACLALGIRIVQRKRRH